MSEIKGLGSVTCRKLLQVFQTPEEIYRAAKGDLLSVAGIGEKTAEIILGSRSLSPAERILEKMARLEIKLLTIEDVCYPGEAANLADAPPVLYYRGELREDSSGVAVIGARRCTAYGKKVAKEAAEFLAKNEVPVISGMAKGIDGYAHTACINAKGYTLAFLGHGLDLCYPPEHLELMEAIVENGAVISEYPPGTPAKQVYFPRRNYLLSAWSHKLLVVEAGYNSGALITAKVAREQGKEVLAVPNGIYNRESYGTNRLIADGAKIFIKPDQLLEMPRENVSVDRSVKQKRKSKVVAEIVSVVEDSAYERQIIELIGSEEVSIEKLALSFTENRKSFLEALSVMELEGKVKRMPGGMYRSC
ncbi:DNA protecting protein DprA [Dethiobacter alkaliphilus AHT 1]|uniref:DNA protecting protein DprA n=2 Tax=Dethiobacter TaxID=427925 RepID=C0GGN8_DETAL|nr:DNA protecting protein DprA [Dethiobacter alkaliphilus AHT 1]